MKRRDDSGFAMLLVLLMGAIIAMTLYMEIPRVVFEAQRQKEQLLIERGEQYKRAIKLFVSPRGAGRWPNKIDELENLNNRRYLRHRFIDPMTGTDEWRLIHIQNGILVDSVTTTNPAKQPGGNQAQSDSTAGQDVGEQSGQDQTARQQGSPAANPALRRRPSDNVNPSGAQPMGADGQPAQVDAQVDTQADAQAEKSSASAAANGTAPAAHPGAQTPPPQPGGAVIGGGIAGLASTLDSDSIMVYADRENYAEWEFIYDPRKDRPPHNPLGGLDISTIQLTSQPIGGLGSSAPGTAGTSQPASSAGRQ
jgi:hypothetical protein